MATSLTVILVRGITMNKTASFNAGLISAMEKQAMTGRAALYTAIPGAVAGAIPGAIGGFAGAEKGKRWQGALKGAGAGALAGGAAGGLMGGLGAHRLKKLMKKYNINETLTPDNFADIAEKIQKKMR